MEQVKTKLEGLIDKMSRKILLLRLESEKLGEDIEMYESWMNRKGYEEKNIGYFNCLPPEIFHKIVDYLPKSRLPETCKSMKVIIEIIATSYVKSVCGSAIKYFEDKFPNDYMSWCEILKDSGYDYIIGNGYIIRRYVGMTHLDGYKVYNYTNRYWYHTNYKVYINSNGYLILNSGVGGITISKNNIIMEFVNCYAERLEGDKYIYLPKDRPDRDIFMKLVDKGKIYKEYRQVFDMHFAKYMDISELSNRITFIDEEISRADKLAHTLREEISDASDNTPYEI
jgi:hypothetical protein